MRDAGLVKYDFELANRVYFDNAEPIRECMTEIFDNVGLVLSPADLKLIVDAPAKVAVLPALSVALMSTV